MIITPETLNPTVRAAGFFHLKGNRKDWCRSNFDWELRYIASGEFIYEQSGRVQRIRQGQLLCNRPGVYHSFMFNPDIDAEGEAVLGAFHFSLPGNEPFVFQPEPLTITTVSNPELIEKAFTHLDDVFHSHGRFRQAQLSGIVKEIWAIASDDWSNPEGVSENHRMTEMMEFLISHAQDPTFGRNQLSEHFNLSPQYINFLFRNYMGTTPTGILQRTRVLRAYNILMETDLPLKEIARSCGFCDEYYLSRIFKRIMGFTPGSVRRNQL